MIDRLSSTAALIAALRADMTRRGGRTVGAGSPNPKTKAAGARLRDVAELRRDLKEIVQHVSPDDRVAVEGVRPRVARAILLWEFGPQLREHPDWQPMLEQIVRTLAGSDQHEAQFVALIRRLQGHEQA